jgi:hypothetical protein
VVFAQPVAASNVSSTVVSLVLAVLALRFICYSNTKQPESLWQQRGMSTPTFASRIDGKALPFVAAWCSRQSETP